MEVSGGGRGALQSWRGAGAGGRSPPRALPPGKPKACRCPIQRRTVVEDGGGARDGVRDEDKHGNKHDCNNVDHGDPAPIGCCARKDEKDEGKAHAQEERDEGAHLGLDAGAAGAAAATRGGA